MKNKLKVATSSMGVVEKRKKIKDYLISHPEGATPKMIACGTTLNVNTVKSILPKLENIKTKHRGWYKVVNKGDGTLISDGTIHSWNFHNLVLTFPVENNNNQHFNSQYGLINVDLKVNNHGICTCRLSTDHPMNLSSISMVYAYLSVFFEQDIPLSKIMVRTIEFNKDYPNLRLDGVNCISLDGLYSQFKLYQKKASLRAEHKTKVHFKADDMLNMLTKSNNHLELTTQMDEQITLLRKLTGQTVMNTNKINALMARQ